jgi:hypothetical protein
LLGHEMMSSMYYINARLFNLMKKLSYLTNEFSFLFSSEERECYITISD